MISDAEDARHLPRWPFDCTCSVVRKIVGWIFCRREADVEPLSIEFKSQSTLSFIAKLCTQRRKARLC